MPEHYESRELAPSELINNANLEGEIPNLRYETLAKVVWCSPEDLDCSLLVELEYSDEEIEQYCNIIRHQDDLLPIVAGDDGSIIAGRGRLEAAMLLGIYQIPTLRLSSMTFDDLDHYIETLVRFSKSVGWTGMMLDTDLRYLFKIDAMAKAAATCSTRWAE